MHAIFRQLTNPSGQLFSAISLAFLSINLVCCLSIPAPSSVALQMSASNNQTATVGTSYILKCSGTNLAISDIVWLYYPVGNSSFTNIIYSDAAYTPGSDLRYEVKSIPTSANTIITNLMIKSVTLADAGFVYQCACNVYKEACTSDTKLVAEVKLKAVTTTTTTTTTSTTTTTTTTTEKITTTSPKPTTIASSLIPEPINLTANFNRTVPKLVAPESVQNVKVCLNEDYNNTEFSLVIISLAILVVSALLFHYSFHGFFKKTKLMFLLIFFASLCILISVIFWINPAIVGGLNYLSVTIVCCTVFGCLTIWILIFHYVIRLSLSDEIKTIVVLLIFIVEFFAGLTGLLLILINFSCSGFLTIPGLSSVNYTYIDITCSVLLLVFSLMVLLIALIICWSPQRTQLDKENNENNFSTFKSSSVNPFPGFIHSQMNRVLEAPTACQQQQRLQEIWFPINTGKVMPELPNLPKRLPPIYKREITHVSARLSPASTCLKIEQPEYELLPRPQAKDTLEQRTKTADREIKSGSTNPNLVNTYSASLDVKEMPLNPFDFIWYSNRCNQGYIDDCENVKANSLIGSVPNWSFGSQNQMIYDDLVNGSSLDFSASHPNLIAIPIQKKPGSSKKSRKGKGKEKKTKKKSRQQTEAVELNT